MIFLRDSGNKEMILQEGPEASFEHSATNHGSSQQRGQQKRCLANTWAGCWDLGSASLRL